MSFKNVFSPQFTFGTGFYAGVYASQNYEVNLNEFFSQRLNILEYNYFMYGIAT